MLFSFDILDPNPTWGAGGGGAGSTLKTVSGVTPKAIWCSLCYRLVPDVSLILSFLLIYFLFLLGFFLNQFIKSRQNIGRRPFGNEERQQKFSDRFRVEIAIFRDFQTFSETSRDFHKCSAMFSHFQRWPEIFIDLQRFSDIFSNVQRFS